MARSKKQLSQVEQVYKEYLELGLDCGCQPDQIDNFFKAGVFLQRKQLEFCALARQCDLDNGPKAILYGGGRGAAKSHGVLAQIFCDDCQRIPGLKVLALRKVGRANKEQISDFRKKLLARLPHKYREQAQEITFENGSMVILGNFKDEKDIDKYLGLEYDLIYIMESNQLTQTKKMNILSCLRTNKPNWRPRCYQDTNPGGIDHWANKQLFVIPDRLRSLIASGVSIQEAAQRCEIGIGDAEDILKKNETRYLHTTVDDNSHVDKGYKEFLEKFTGWQREAWLFGSWDFLAGAYFTNFREDIHVYPNKNVNLISSNARRWFASFDYGFGHRSAFILCAQDHQNNIYAVDEYTESELTPAEHAERIKSLLRKHKLEPSDLDTIVAGHDCFHRKEEGHTIAQTYEENGLLFIPAENARVNGWQRILDGFGDMNTGTRPTLFINRNCIHLIAQIKMAQHHEKIPGDIQKFDYSPSDVEVMGENMNEGDDCLDAFRYAIFSNTENGMKFCAPITLNGFQPAMLDFKI